MKLKDLFITLHNYLEAYDTEVNACRPSCILLTKIYNRCNLPSKIIMICWSSEVSIRLIKFEDQQNSQDINIASVKETDVSWVIYCDDDINLIRHKLRKSNICISAHKIKKC
jgi:hypothetical protein